MSPSIWANLRGKDMFVERSERSKHGGEELLSVSAYFGVKPRREVLDDLSELSRAESLVDYKVCFQNDFIINTMLAWNGSMGLATQHGIVSPAYGVYEINSGVVSPRFVPYLMTSVGTLSAIRAVSRGINDARLRLYPDKLASLVFSVPPLPEQIAITDYLDKKTALIDKQRALLERKKALLQEHRRALIHEAVTKGLTPGVAMKPSGVDWIGDVPAGWGVIRLRDVISQSNAGEVIDKGWWGDGVENLFTCASEPMTSSFPCFPEWKRTKGNDLLLTRNATPYVFEPAPGSIYSNVVQRIMLKKGVDVGFLAMIIRAGVDSMFSFGVSIPSFSMEVWGNLHLPLPPMPVQREIMKSLQGPLSAYDEFDILAKKKIDLLANWKSAVIHEAVTQGVPA